MRRSLFLLTAVLTACPRPPPPPPPLPAPRPNVPGGCLDLLDGVWLHEADPTFRYVARDDGGTVVFSVEHHLARDAGFVPRRFGKPVDAGADAGAAPDGGALGGSAFLPDAGLPADGGRATDAGADDAGLPATASALVLDSDGCMPSAPSPTTVVLQRTGDGFVGQTHAMLLHPTGRWCEVTFRTEVLACGDGGLTLRTETGRALGEECQAPAHPLPEPLVVQRLVRPSLDAGP